MKTMNKFVKAVALLGMGGATFQLAGSAGGCKNAVVADVVTGIGNGAIAAGTDAAFAGLPEEWNQFVKVPVFTGLSNGWSNFIAFRFPVITVRSELFQQ